MKAALIRAYGDAIDVTETDAPEIVEGAVLIDVHAASLNPIDHIVVDGHLKSMIDVPFPHVIGYDVSGIVSAVGAGVTSVKAGDAVFARQRQEDAGALAEVALVHEMDLAKVPAGVSHEQAASLPLAGLTAWQALFDKAGLKEGQKVLVHAGSGGVGTLAIQIAKHAGAHVTTTVGARNMALARDLGADVVIDYGAEKFEDAGDDFDVVFDMIGGETLKRSFAIVRKGGHVVSIKGQDEDGLAEKHGVHFDWFFMEPNGAQLAELGELVATGVVRTVIDKTYALDDAAAAMADMRDGHATGKLVVKVR